MEKIYIFVIMSWDEAFNWAIKMHPNELQNMGWGWVNPLPQNEEGLLAAFKDGAVGAKEKTKENIKRHTEMTETARGFFENMIPYWRIIKRYPWLATLNLEGSTRIEKPENEE